MKAVGIDDDISLFQAEREPACLPNLYTTVQYLQSTAKGKGIEGLVDEVEYGMFFGKSSTQGFGALIELVSFFGWNHDIGCNDNIRSHLP